MVTTTQPMWYFFGNLFTTDFPRLHVCFFFDRPNLQCHLLASLPRRAFGVHYHVVAPKRVVCNIPQGFANKGVVRLATVSYMSITESMPQTILSVGVVADLKRTAHHTTWWITKQAVRIPVIYPSSNNQCHCLSGCYH